MNNELQTHQIKRIAHNATNPNLRGQVVSIVGFRGATHFDVARVIVRPVQADGSLGDEYLMTPGIIIAL